MYVNVYQVLSYILDTQVSIPVFMVRILDKSICNAKLQFMAPNF